MTPDILARLHGVAFAQTRGWSAAEFAALLADPAVVLTGDARGFVLGRVTLDEAEILAVATDPALRRRGLARAALAAFEAAAVGRGATVALLEVAQDNEAACALYVGAGYAQVGRRPAYYVTGDGTADALILRKALAGSPAAPIRAAF